MPVNTWNWDDYYSNSNPWNLKDRMEDVNGNTYFLGNVFSLASEARTKYQDVEGLTEAKNVLTSDGGGVVDVTTVLAISATSPYVQEAWNFIEFCATNTGGDYVETDDGAAQLSTNISSINRESARRQAIGNTGDESLGDLYVSFIDQARYVRYVNEALENNLHEIFDDYYNGRISEKNARQKFRSAWKSGWRSKKGQGVTMKRKSKICWLMFLPSLIGVLLFYGIPFVFALWYAFVDNLGTQNFVGLRNFRDLLGSPLFQTAAKNTLIFTVQVVPLGMVLAFLLAMCLKNLKRGACRCAAPAASGHSERQYRVFLACDFRG